MPGGLRALWPPKGPLGARGWESGAGGRGLGAGPQVAQAAESLGERTLGGAFVWSSSLPLRFSYTAVGSNATQKWVGRWPDGPDKPESRSCHLADRRRAIQRRPWGRVHSAGCRPGRAQTGTRRRGKPGWRLGRRFRPRAREEEGTGGLSTYRCPMVLLVEG